MEFRLGMGFMRRTPPTGKLEHRSHEPLFRKLLEIILACGRFMDGRKRCQEGGKTRACICAVGASGVGRASTRPCRAKTPVGRTRGLGCPVNRRVGRRPPVGLSKRNPKSDRKINRRNIRNGIRFSAINFSAVRPCLSMNLPMVAADVRRTPPTEKLEHRSHEPLFRKLLEIILACGRFMDRRSTLRITSFRLLTSAATLLGVQSANLGSGNSHFGPPPQGDNSPKDSRFEPLNRSRRSKEAETRDSQRSPPPHVGGYHGEDAPKN